MPPWHVRGLTVSSEPPLREGVGRQVRVVVGVQLPAALPGAVPGRMALTVTPERQGRAVVGVAVGLLKEAKSFLMATVWLRPGRYEISGVGGAARRWRFEVPRHAGPPVQRQVREAAGTPGYEARVHAAACLLLLELVQAHPNALRDRWGRRRAGEARDPRVQAAMDYMEERVDQTPSIAAVARRVSCEGSTLRKLFHRTFGQSPKARLTVVRMEQALELLRDPSLGVDDIASRVGYQSRSGFYRAFTTHFRTTPRLARLSALGEGGPQHIS